MSNPTIIQFFHWYTPADGQLWDRIAAEAQSLADCGINMLWLPPAYKAASGGYSVGYDAYDLYDFGEFDQKGTVPTKYGTREALERAIKALNQHGISAMADVVMNHKGGADEEERIQVIRVDEGNRAEVISDTFEISAWTKFTFPGRKGLYSDFIWDSKCFSGVDYASDLQESGIFAIHNDFESPWEPLADEEFGNYDYLMYCDVEFRNPAVQAELKKWAEWMVNTFNIEGFRLDAGKHITPYFLNDWLDHIRGISGKPMFTVAEYWNTNLDLIHNYLHLTEGRMSVFDVPLHYRLSEASKQGNGFNMTTIFDGTLVQSDPLHAVTFVDNHDTQPLQGLESPVDTWFKPLAYALILLREGGVPCVFEPDMYGAEYTDKGSDGNDCTIVIMATDKICEMATARQRFAYGSQKDYFDDPNVIGWTRAGVEAVEGSGCAVILTNGEGSTKYMQVGQQFANATFYDFLHRFDHTIDLDENGGAAFPVQPGSVSVWVKKMEQ